MAKFQVGDRVAIVGEAGHTGTIVEVTRPTMGAQRTRVYAVQVDGSAPSATVLRLGQMNLEHLIEQRPIPTQTRRAGDYLEPEPEQPAQATAEPAPAPAPQPQLPPAGWYQDPERADLKRWWDGTAWTEHRTT
ncbi:MAG: DUF2510 domain-containing protein [Nocardioidaceae bacterium]